MELVAPCFCIGNRALAMFAAEYRKHHFQAGAGGIFYTYYFCCIPHHQMWRKSAQMLSFRLFQNQQSIDDSRYIFYYPNNERTIFLKYFFNPKSVAHGEVDCEDLLGKP